MKTDKIYFSDPPKTRKNFFFRLIFKAAILTLAAFILLSLAVYFWLDINAHKPLIERLVKQHSSLEIKLNGPLKLTIFNTVRFQAKNIQLSLQGKAIAHITQFNFNFAILPLFQNQLEITKLHLDIENLQINQKQLISIRDVTRAQKIKSLPQPPIHISLHGLDPTFLYQYIPKVKQASISEFKLQLKLFEYIDNDKAWHFDSENFNLKFKQLPVPFTKKLDIQLAEEFLKIIKSVQLNADSVRINKHHLTALNLNLNRQKKQLKLSSLQTNYQYSAKNTQINFDLRAKSLFQLSHHPEKILSTKKNAPQYHHFLSFEHLELDLKQINLKTKTNKLQFNNNQILLQQFQVDTNNAANQFIKRSFTQWMLSSQFTAKIYSSQIIHKDDRLNNFNFNVQNHRGKFEISLTNLTALYHSPKNSFLSKQPTQFNLHLNLFGKGLVSPASTSISQLEINSNEFLINIADKDIYRLKPTKINMSELLLIKQGQFLLSSIGELKTLPKNASIQSNGVYLNGQGLQNINITLNTTDNNLKLDPIQFDFAQSVFIFNGMLDLSDTPYFWHIQGGSDALKLAPLFAFFKQEGTQYKETIDGHGKLSIDLYGESFTPDLETPGQLDGQLEFNAQKVFIKQLDLDSLIDHFENSQSVGLYDIGAYAIAGPIGLVLIKGNAYHNLIDAADDNSGSSTIQQLHLSLDLENTLLDFTDSALTTEKHLLAVKGAMDLTQNRYQNIQLATIDANGCDIYTENISGPLNNPKIVGANRIVKTIVNPIKSVVKNAQDLLTISCQQPFYQGSLTYPTPANNNNNSQELLSTPKKILKPIKKITGLLNDSSHDEEHNESESGQTADSSPAKQD